MHSWGAKGGIQREPTTRDTAGYYRKYTVKHGSSTIHTVSHVRLLCGILCLRRWLATANIQILGYEVAKSAISMYLLGQG